MALDPRTPVLVGAGQVLSPPDPDLALNERPEPVELMAEALRTAAQDCGGTGAGERLLRCAQSLRVMVPLSWRYVDPAQLVADRLGIEVAEHALSVIGGNSPQTIVADAATAIAHGHLDVVLVAGAECTWTRLAARRGQDRVLPWTTQSPATPPPVLLGAERAPVTDDELAQGLDRPRNVFPLFENALRAAAGEGIEEHQRRVSRLWSRFSEVAASNPHAWSRRVWTPEELSTVSQDNRMVAFPYPKRMNANDRVDMGAALIVCSLGAALSAGVPDDRMVFPLAAADAHDHWFLSQRRDLHSSPAIAAAASAALSAAGVGSDDVRFVDLYSCFPCAVQMAAAAIGLELDDPSRPLTVTGGLSFAGGPGNNYVTHSLAALAQRLRTEPGAVGLVTGLGWYATKHAVGLWSSAPGRVPFRHVVPQEEVDAAARRAPASDPEGELIVETYTVIHDRAGQPQLGILALLDAEGRRAWANVTAPDDLWGLETEEGCGRRVKLLADGRVDLR